MIVAGFITAFLLIVIGSAMDKHEKAQRERDFQEWLDLPAAQRRKRLP